MTRIDELLTAMTLDEKIGQLNMMAAGYAVTGPVIGSEIASGIRAGQIGSLLNLWGAEKRCRDAKNRDGGHKARHPPACGI